MGVVVVVVTIIIEVTITIIIKLTGVLAYSTYNISV